jgi:SAM-dependent methyltransferase
MNETKLNEFLGKVVGDIGAAMSAVMVLLGDKLGLYKGIAKLGPCTSAELAKETGTAERYVREWLGNQAAGGYVVYEPKTERYHLPPEQAFALADEGSPAFMPGAFQLINAMFKSEPRIFKNFRTGEGLDWCDQDQSLFEGTERFFRPGYVNNLVQAWLPTLDGVVAKLQAGGKVADVGCGHGASTIVMAQAFPKSRFVGFDYHKGSIEVARRRAKAAGVEDRVAFEVASAAAYPGDNYDLVTLFDCLHDMGDPLAAARHVRKTLSKSGSWMVVEPFAGDKLEENLNPVGRVFYAASTCVCVPASLAHHGPALGAQAGEKRTRALALEAGFSSFRRATQTPFNLVYEGKA